MWRNFLSWHPSSLAKHLPDKSHAKCRGRTSANPPESCAQAQARQPDAGEQWTWLLCTLSTPRQCFPLFCFSWRYKGAPKTVFSQCLAVLRQLRACRHSPKKRISTHRGTNDASGLWFPACPPCHSEGHGLGKQSTLLAA